MKKLLIKLRDRIKGQTSIYSGLCYEISLMRICREITVSEASDLENYVSQRRPKKGKHFDPVNNYSPYGYYWACSEVAPRLAWLNDQIKNFHNNR